MFCYFYLSHIIKSDRLKKGIFYSNPSENLARTLSNLALKDDQISFPAIRHCSVCCDQHCQLGKVDTTYINNHFDFYL